MAGLIAAAYLGTIVAANWLVVHVGLVPVGFNLVAPAGVYAAGLAFTLRDLLHERAGLRGVLLAIGGGTILSAVISPQLAIASGTAFLVSELLDLAVYTPLRQRGWVLAVVASNLVGLIADSALFLGLAFGSLDYLVGQVVGKLWMTALAVGVLWISGWGRTRPTGSRPRLA